MTQALLVVGGLFLLIYVPLALLAWRRPLLARFAWREATRRRGQFALLVIGLMVGSASITASLIAADSSTQTLDYAFSQRLGAVDLTVTSPGSSSFPSDIATKLAADPSLHPYVDGVQGGVELQASVSDLDQRLGKSGVLLVGFDPGTQRRFGPYVLTDGRRLYGEQLALGDVVLSRDLASALDAKVGDRIRINTGTGSGSADLRVYAISALYGPGAYGSPVATFMTLGTAAMVTGDPGINVIRIAARGGTPSDTAPAQRAEAPLRAAVTRIPSAAPLVVSDVRLDAAHQVQGQTAWNLGITLAFSALTVLAATALIVNLVVALAEERRSRLAVLRALGLTRAGMVTLSVLEGALYSLVAAAVGVAAGVLAGLYLAGQLWNTFVIDPGDLTFLGFPMQIIVSPITLGLGFAAGSLVILATVAAAAYQTSRIAIAAAVRDLPEPASARQHPWIRAAVLAGLGAIGGALVLVDDPRTRLIGGIALITTTGALARGRLPDRARVTLAGVLVSAWAVLSLAETKHLVSDLGILVSMVFLGVAVPAVGLSIAAAANLKAIDRAVGLVGTRLGLLQATLRPPLAYLSRRPVRTGLATSAFSLVLVFVSILAVVVASNSRDYSRDSAGYDLEVVTSASVPIQLPAEVEQHVSGRTTIPMRLYQGPFSDPAGFGGGGSSTRALFYVFSAQAQDRGPVHLSSRDGRFSSDADVWQAVSANPRLVVYIGSNGDAPGDLITVQGHNGPINLRIAGDEASSILNGIIASPATLADIATSPAGSTVLLSLKPGSDARALARDVERSLFAQGVQAASIRDILDQDYASSIAYDTEYDVLLHMGLLVGVLALAMIGIRAAVERRRAIGILRALGYQPLRVLVGLVVEAGLTATMGVISGLGAGLLLGFVIVNATLPGETFAVSYARVAVALAIVYGTVVVVTGPLAARATRMAPVEAIRLTG